VIAYSFNYPDTSLEFKFGTVKLLDYQNRWSELEASDLTEAGIPKEQIVLGFREPELRQYTGYALA
jgi:XisI protein